MGGRKEGRQDEGRWGREREGRKVLRLGGWRRKRREEKRRLGGWLEEEEEEEVGEIDGRKEDRRNDEERF